MSNLVSSGNDCTPSSKTDIDYFDCYDDISVHELMLRDVARVEAYKNFIENNVEHFFEKTVLDVGSGTGILSLFAAKAGAKHVFSIEAGSKIANLSREIIKRNGYEDRITVIDGRIEDVNLPDGEMADVIISEWMGFYLFHESMISAVITARDRLLKPNGFIFPSSGTLYICPVVLKDYVRERFDFWKNVYGFDFGDVASLARTASIAKPDIMTVSQQSLLAQPQQVISIDLKYVDMDDVNSMFASVDFIVERNDIMHGFALWFDVFFEGRHSVVLNTSPSAEATHWKQTVALLPDALLVNRSAQLSCRVQLVRQERRYNISIELLDDDDDVDDDGGDGDEISADDQNAQSDFEPKNVDINCDLAELQDIISNRMEPV